MENDDVLLKTVFGNGNDYKGILKSSPFIKLLALKFIGL